MARSRLNFDSIRARPGTLTQSNGWVIQCPAHDDRTPSLSIQMLNGQPVWKCHAGCSQADVQAALIREGFLIEDGRSRYRPPGDEARRKQAWIARTWDATVPISGTPAAEYLLSRGLPQWCTTLSSLRWHAQTKQMMAEFVDNDGKRFGLHRTTIPGKVRRAIGPIKGCAIQLMPTDLTFNGTLAVAEGIETALAFADIYQTRTWALYNATNMAAWIPPGELKHLVIAADFDGAGLQAAEKLLARLPAGISGEIRLPGGMDYYGSDWNDILNQRNPK